MASTGRIVAIGAAAAVALLVLYTVYQFASVPGPYTSPVPSQFTVNGKTYPFTYTATNQDERVAGLMNRKVTNTTTMLFAFPYPGVWLFWMKDTNTSLDMIWVKANGTTGEVVYVQASAPPCLNVSWPDSCPEYGSQTAEANFVIEAKAGFASSNGVSTGTQIQFSGFGASP